MNKKDRHADMDLLGQRFGRLTAIAKVEGKTSTWVFECDCGNIVILKTSRILGGQKSCGCLRKEVAIEWAKSHTTHGDSKTKLYRKYRSMINRCYSASNHNYKRYGGRGIKVCDEWLNSFEAFKEWAYSTGYDPSLDGKKEQSIDRIDNDGNYCPENCRWATAREQQKNRECTTLYPYNDQMYSASEFADIFGITEKTFVYNRLKRGQTLEYILEDWTKIHNVPSNLADVKEYAEMQGVTTVSVNRWISNKKIEAVRIGRKWYIDKGCIPIGKERT